MATTTKKSTSTSKTNTSKVKSSTKQATSKKPTVKKVNSGASVQKKTAKASSVSKVKSFRAVEVTLHSLRSMNIAAAGLFVLLALLAGYLMSSASYMLTIGHVAKDDLASKTQTVFAPAVQPVLDIEVRWMVVGILLLSAVFPILYLSKLKERYAEYLNKTRMQPFRWIDFAITSALMTSVAAILSGVNDIATLEILAGVVGISAVVAIIAERQNNSSSKLVRSAFLTGAVTVLLPWLLIAMYATTTIIYGMVRSPWYVYAIYITLLVGVALQWRNQRMHLKGANHIIVERNYIAITILTKAAFAIILIAGLAK